MILWWCFNSVCPHSLLLYKSEYHEHYAKYLLIWSMEIFMLILNVLFQSEIHQIMEIITLLWFKDSHKGKISDLMQPLRETFGQDRFKRRWKRHANVSCLRQPSPFCHKRLFVCVCGTCECEMGLWAAHSREEAAIMCPSGCQRNCLKLMTIKGDNSALIHHPRSFMSSQDSLRQQNARVN